MTGSNPEAEILPHSGLTIDLNRMLKPGTRGVLSAKMPDGSWKVIGTVKAKRRLSKGFRKHKRLLKSKRAL